MSNTVLVLSRSYQESASFIKKFGLRGARPLSSAQGMAGARPKVILELPSYRSRFDVFAVENQIQRNTIRSAPPIRMLVDPDEIDLVVDQGDGMGQQLTIDDVLTEEPHGEEARAPEPSEDPAPAPKVESPAAERKKRKPRAEAKPASEPEPELGENDIAAQVGADPVLDDFFED